GRKAADIATDPAGNIAVVWIGGSIFEDLILLRRFDSEARPVSEIVQVHQRSGRRRETPRVAMNGDGSLLVSGTAVSRVNVTVRRFDGPTGSWADEVRLTAPLGGRSTHGTPVLYPEGDGTVVFADLRAIDVGVFAQRLDAGGKPFGGVVE